MQIWIEIEENGNCGYHPLQTFEVRGRPETGAAVVVESLPGASGPSEVVGWCSEGGGPCGVTVVLVGDSGAGTSRLIRGGDNGLRVRPAGSGGEWSLKSGDQSGEPYILLPEAAVYRVVDPEN